MASGGGAAASASASASASALTAEQEAVFEQIAHEQGDSDQEDEVDEEAEQEVDLSKHVDEATWQAFKAVRRDSLKGVNEGIAERLSGILEVAGSQVGDAHPELAEMYYYYAISLLDECMNQAANSAGLGNIDDALQGDEEVEEDMATAIDCLQLSAALFGHEMHDGKAAAKKMRIDALFRIGKLLMEAGDYEASAVELAAVAELCADDGSNPDASYEYAKRLEQLSGVQTAAKQFDEARDTLKTAIGLLSRVANDKPDNEAQLRQLLKSLTQRHDEIDALKRIQKEGTSEQQQAGFDAPSAQGTARDVTATLVKRKKSSSATSVEPKRSKSDAS